MKITAQMHAFIRKGSMATPQELQTEKGLGYMSFFSHKDNWAEYGYAYIGVAEVTVDVPDERELIDNKVAALREEIKTARAEVTAKVTQLEGQIQQLLCIEHNQSMEPQHGHL